MASMGAVEQCNVCELFYVVKWLWKSESIFYGDFHVWQKDMLLFLQLL
jgi:hypothetical protein